MPWRRRASRHRSKGSAGELLSRVADIVIVADFGQMKLETVLQIAPLLAKRSEDFWYVCVCVFVCVGSLLLSSPDFCLLLKS